MRIVDSRTIEVDCTSCAVTFLTSRGEDGEPDETMCSDCWETLEDHRRTIAQERDRVWFATFLSFPFKQLPAPDPIDRVLADLDWADQEAQEQETWRQHQAERDAADQAAYYSPSFAGEDTK